MPVQDGPLEESVYDQPPQVGPFDPATVQPTSSAAPSSTAPGFGSTSGADGAQPSQEAEPGTGGQQEPPLPQFDPRHRDAFEGLIHIGALTETFPWLGHRFTIRTLTTGELAEVALLVAKYEQTQMASKVWQAATVAGCLISVDDRPLPAPLTTDPGDTPLKNRFDYVMARWFPPVLDAVYDRYIRLELQVRDVIAAMGNRSG